ncbi:MAG: rhodanese family protein [Enhydrobacter sp.]|nr:rhodanese family protein [Enhydrobacter sp.]
MSLQTIDAPAAKRLIDQGAILIDIREADEHGREHVPGARNVPLSRLGSLPAGTAKAMVFHCRSGARTSANAPRIAAAAGCQAYILEGGIEAWKTAGLPVATDRSQPIEIMRQVQIVAGSLVLAGITLGVWVAPAFLGLAAFVGAGLVFAGASGWCGMAKLLGQMPWNRRPAKNAVA